MASALCSARLGEESIVLALRTSCSPGLPNLCCETDHLCEKKLGSNHDVNRNMDCWSSQGNSLAD